MTAILKVDTIQDTAGNNIINESSDTITIGASGDTISIPSGATIANSGTATGFGKVLQVVNTTSSTQRTTNSTSFSDSGLAVSITPSATSSKILIIFSSSGYADTTGESSIYTLYRDSTNLGDSSNGNMKFTNGGSNLEYGMNFQVYDSPSSTSAISYKVYQRASGGNAISYISRSTIPSYLTAMEIAGWL